ncbi:uncharacterized protein A1O5_12433 [Cladophialophora psammophila CBS 110553]|uniref:Uncharacterized protein n=1 Tax=Cladophialophora psammophila CBS 110553 TaxID=1182543 RepID=W9VYV1_9EURO|nr:uncharacterized protein A1O5_12433 [Cladophialophora psammophila CBS 110553]EXJ57875.1 hypothetical protein A1O5_12433 [Cladophialophora psammophila CBS 110553]
MAQSWQSPLKTKEYLAMIGDFPDNVPVTVIHMLRFNEQAIYPPSSPHASLEPTSGRDAFWKRYVPAGNTAAQKLGIKPAETLFFSDTVTNLLQHNDIPWDVVTARKYESFAVYARYQKSMEYSEWAAPHRDAALKDWSLVACIQGELPKA